MKIKIMLIRLILLRPNSNNKVKILGMSFISKDLILNKVDHIFKFNSIP